jgi:prevent-host-death family protein
VVAAFALWTQMVYHDYGHYYSHFEGTAMQTIQASEFKAKCLALMDQVAATGEGILITKNGKPVAELRPPSNPRPKSPFGLHKGMIKIAGDIISPIDVKWDAHK